MTADHQENSYSLQLARLHITRQTVVCGMASFFTNRFLRTSHETLSNPLNICIRGAWSTPWTQHYYNNKLKHATRIRGALYRTFRVIDKNSINLTYRSDGLCSVYPKQQEHYLFILLIISDGSFWNTLYTMYVNATVKNVIRRYFFFFILFFDKKYIIF